MTLFIASYDLHNARNYTPLWTKLQSWGAVRLFESVWLFSRNETVGSVRQELQSTIDNDDSVGVIELKAGSSWASIRAKPEGVAWLQKNIQAY